MNIFTILCRQRPLTVGQGRTVRKISTKKEEESKNIQAPNGEQNKNTSKFSLGASYATISAIIDPWQSWIEAAVGTGLTSLLMGLTSLLTALFIRSFRHNAGLPQPLVHQAKPRQTSKSHEPGRKRQPDPLSAESRPLGP